MDKSELPKNWETIKLDDSCRKVSINKIKIKQKNYLETGKFPIVDQGQDLIGGYFDDESLVVPEEPPYIVFGDHTKVKKFINFHFVAGADGIKVLKPYSIYLPKFFFYLLHVVKIPDKGYARHFQYLAKAEIPLPPLREQERIVAKIEELFSELDAGIENLKTAQAQLKTYRQAVLKYAFEGKFTNDNVKEGELPEGWKWEKLGDSITKIEAGKSSKCDERPPRQGETGIVKVSAVSWGEFNENESKTIFSDKQYNEKYLIKKDDFLFSRANTIELVGACVIVKNFTKKLMLSDKTLRFIFNKNIKKAFALYFLRSYLGRKEIESLSTGNQDSMRNIGQARIKEIKIPIPSIIEQQKIVEEIESRLSVCDKLEETIAASLAQSEALRQSILKKAFEGKLVPQEEGERVELSDKKEESQMKLFV